MASQVRPGSIQPCAGTGLQQSAGVIRHRPAYSIRARGFEPHTEAGCMGCNLPCDPECKNTLGNQGRPCMPATSTGGSSSVLAAHETPGPNAGSPMPPWGREPARGRGGIPAAKQASVPAVGRRGHSWRRAASTIPRYHYRSGARRRDVRGTLRRSAPFLDRGKRLAIHRGRTSASSHCGRAPGRQAEPVDRRYSPPRSKPSIRWYISSWTPILTTSPSASFERRMRRPRTKMPLVLFRSSIELPSRVVTIWA